MAEPTEETSDFSLGKRYKLCGRKSIEEVFQNGTTVKAFPFIALIQQRKFNDSNPVKFVFSAPKRTFKKAHKRNRIKRICREAVRLNKKMLEDHLSQNAQQLAIVLIYSSKEEMKLEQLQRKTQKLFNAIIKHLNDTNT